LQDRGSIVLGRRLPKDRSEPSAIRDECVQEPAAALHLSVLENLGHHRDGRKCLFDATVIALLSDGLGSLAVGLTIVLAVERSGFEYFMQPLRWFSPSLFSCRVAVG
jgi:hypothetical protein